MLHHTEAHMTSAGKKYSGPSMIALASELLQIKITCLMNCIYCHIRKSQWAQALKLCERIVDDSIAQGRMSPIEMLRLMYFKCFAMINNILNASMDDLERVQKMTDVKDAVQDMLRLLLNSHVRNENNFKGAMNDFREIFELYTLLGNAIPNARAILDLAPEELSVLAKLRKPPSVHDAAGGIVDSDRVNYEADGSIKPYNHDIQQTDLQAQQVIILGKHLEISEKKRVDLMLKHRIAVAALQAEKDEGARQLAVLSAQLVVSDSKCAELSQQLEAVRAQNEENQKLLSLMSSQLESSKIGELLQLLQQEQEENSVLLSASSSIGNGRLISSVNDGAPNILPNSKYLSLDEIPSEMRRETGVSSNISQNLLERGVEMDSANQPTNVTGSKGPHDLVTDVSVSLKESSHLVAEKSIETALDKQLTSEEEPKCVALEPVPVLVESNSRDLMVVREQDQRLNEGVLQMSSSCVTDNQPKPPEQHPEVVSF